MSDSKQKSSYEHGSDFERLRSYGHFFNSRTRPHVNRAYGTSWRLFALQALRLPADRI